MQINQLFVIFFLVLCQGWWAQGSSPPRMNVTSGEYVVNTTYFSLRCEGSQPLFWNWTTGEAGHVDIIDSQHSNTDHPYVSVLTLNDPLLADIGYYYCYYADAGDWQTDQENVDLTYVYIHDGSTAFVDSSIFIPIQATTSQKLEIPCRTTLPNIRVTLLKSGEDITSDQRLSPFDPRVGFVLSDLKLQDTDLYTCRPEQEQFLDKNYRVLIQTSDSMNLSKPSIDTDASQHFVVGLSFRLKCMLLQEESEVVFRWTLPNPERVNLPVKSKVGKHQVSTLTIPNATLADSGKYICTVSASGHHPNNDYISVEVMETLEPYINITSDLSSINRTEGDTIIWKASVHAYPADPILVYRNWTGLEVEESDRVSTEHRANSAESWLYLRNLTSLDHGTYTLEGSTRYQQVKDSTSYRVEVLSKPTPWLEEVPEYASPGQEVTLSCVARGFPLPNTNWLFRSCPGGTLGCNSTFQKLQVREPNVTYPDPGNIKNVRVTFTPETSGSLRCRVNNEYGQQEATKSIPISDIGGLFVLDYNGEAGKVAVSDDVRSVKVVVSDTFHLLCAATKFNYASVQLSFSGSGPGVVVNESEWSRQHVVEGKVTEGHQGTYTCTAIPHDGGIPLVKKLQVTVHPEERVTFLDDANMKPNGYTVMVKEKTYFSLNCTVSGTPPPSVTWFKIYNDPELLELEGPDATAAPVLTFVTPPAASPTDNLSVSRTAKGTSASTTGTSNRPTHDPSPTPSTSGNRPRKRVCDETDNVLQEALHQLRGLSSSREITDANTDFGNVVVNDLRYMSDDNKVYAQKLIHDILYLGKLRKLSSSTTIIE